MGLLMIDGRIIHANDDIGILPVIEIPTVDDISDEPPDGNFGLYFNPLEYTIEIKPYPWLLRRFWRHVMGWKAKGPMRLRQIRKARKLQTHEVWE